MKRATLLPITALLLAACGDAPMQPEAERTALTPDSPSFSIAAASAALDFASDLDMITTLVVPSLDDATAAAKIKLEVGKLSAALSAGNKVAAAQSVAAVRALLTPGVGGPADVGMIEIVLDNIGRALQ
jgi:hypothetical protein